jgi:hypothetical protein
MVAMYVSLCRKLARLKQARGSLSGRRSDQYLSDTASSLYIYHIVEDRTSLTSSGGLAARMAETNAGSYVSATIHACGQGMLAQTKFTTSGRI